jgi:hypothetical protein
MVVRLGLTHNDASPLATAAPMQRRAGFRDRPTVRRNHLGIDTVERLRDSHTDLPRRLVVIVFFWKHSQTMEAFGTIRFRPRILAIHRRNFDTEQLDALGSADLCRPPQAREVVRAEPGPDDGYARQRAISGAFTLSTEPRDLDAASRLLGPANKDRSPGEVIQYLQIQIVGTDMKRRRWAQAETLCEARYTLRASITA